MRCERGFTLIELLAVVVLFGLTIAIVAPSLSRTLPRSALSATTAEIRATLRGAGSTAISEGRTVVFRGDPAGTGYWLDRRFHPLAATSGSATRLRVAVAGSGRLSFFPWGGSSGGRVWIDGPDGRREIDVDAVTGHAVVKP